MSWSWRPSFPSQGFRGVGRQGRNADDEWNLGFPALSYAPAPVPSYLCCVWGGDLPSLASLLDKALSLLLIRKRGTKGKEMTQEGPGDYIEPMAPVGRVGTKFSLTNDRQT